MPHFQTIVDRDAAEDEADALAKRAIEWLADEHIIDQAPSRCLPDSERLGYRPGEDWQAAIVELDEYFLGLDVNGMQVDCGRQVFDAGVYETRPFCPRCHEPRDAGPDWQEALDAWRAGDEEAAFGCPKCARTSPLVDWRHDPPIGFGCLGFRFWNWPSINREFIERLGAVLEHRLVLVEGRVE